MLIKAFKEHERRNGLKEGFAHTPADALAFKYYRDVSHHIKLSVQEAQEPLNNMIWLVWAQCFWLSQP